MLHLLVILIFVPLHLYDGPSSWGEGFFSPPRGGAWWTGVPLSMLGLWGVTQAYVAACGRRLDRRGEVDAIRKAETAVLAFRLACVAILCAGVYLLGWLEAVRAVVGDLPAVDEVIAAAPAIAGLVAGWWTLYPIERRLREAMMMRHLHEGRTLYAPPSRWKFVLAGLRHNLLIVAIPITLIIGWQEMVEDYAASHRGWARSLDGLTPVLAQIAGAVVVFAMTPAILRLVWDATPIGEGPLRSMIRETCARYRVRVRGPLLWKTGGTILNGAILGLVWPFRYLLFTDALLDSLTTRQLEGVVAHEVAHVRRRHLLWLAASVLAVLIVTGWGAELADRVFDLGLAADPHSATLVSVGSLVVAGFAFGFVSRRFEWQADAFAVQHLSRTGAGGVAGEGDAETDGRITAEAAASMAGALTVVAELNGMSIDKFTWRHGSIAERRRRVLALVGTPVARSKIDRQVGWIKIAAAAMLLVGMTPLIVGLVIG